MSQLLNDFARHLASTLHQDYPADGVNKIRVSCHELTCHYTKAVNAAATLVALHFCPEESGVTRNRRERFDVVLRNNQGRIVGVGEWEYQRLMRSGRVSQNINEITKLKEICTSHPHQPQFACYIADVTEQQVQAASMLVIALWAGTPAPLLLVLIHF